MFNSFFLVLGFVFVCFFIIDNFFRTIRDQMILILIDTCKVTYRSKGPDVFIYCKLNIHVFHILYIIHVTHVTRIKHSLTYLLTYLYATIVVFSIDRFENSKFKPKTSNG